MKRAPAPSTQPKWLKHQLHIVANWPDPFHKLIDQPIPPVAHKQKFLKPLFTLPTAKFNRLQELYWMTASLDAAWVPFPAWVTHFLPGPDGMPTMQRSFARWLFRRVDPADILCLALRGFRIHGLPREVLSDHRYEIYRNRDIPDQLIGNLRYEPQDGDGTDPVLVPASISCVEEAVLVGLIVAGQAGWPLAAQLTRLLQKSWPNARLSVSHLQTIIGSLDLNPFSFIAAGVRIRGLKKNDLHKLLRQEGVKPFYGNYIAHYFGKTARTVELQECAELHSYAMEDVIACADAFPARRIQLFDILETLIGKGWFGPSRKGYESDVTYEAEADRQLARQSRQPTAKVRPPPHEQTGHAETRGTASSDRAAKSMRTAPDEPLDASGQKFRPGLRPITPKKP